MSEEIKIRYQLLRAKSGNYKEPTSQASLIHIESVDESGKRKITPVQEMEVICTDYPLEMPLVVYNEMMLREVVAGQPFLVYNGELYAIYNFIQLEENTENEIVINIWVLYVCEAENSQLTKV